MYPQAWTDDLVRTFSEWQSIATIAAVVVAIVVPTTLYVLSRRHKALSYEVISSTRLFRMEKEVGQKLQILFNGREVQDVHLVEVRITNSGNLPITSPDYERPVSLLFDQNSQILTAEVSKTNPENLRASVSVQSRGVTISPILMNGGDSITIKMLISKFDSQVNVDGRIVGVKEIRKATGIRGFYATLASVGIIMSTASLFLVAQELPVRPGPLPQSVMIYAFVFFTGYVLLLISYFGFFKKRVLQMLARLIEGR